MLGFAPDQPLFLTLPVALFLGIPLVMLFFAFGEADLELDPAVLEMQIERYEGVTGALDFADQALEFTGVQQQLSRASRIGLNVCGSGGQGGDMSPDEVQPAILHYHIRLGDLRATCPDGLGFPATKRHARFVLLFDEVVVKGFAILDDAHGRDAGVRTNEVAWRLGAGIVSARWKKRCT